MIDYSKFILPELKKLDNQTLVDIACDVHSTYSYLELQGMVNVGMEGRRIVADILAILEERKKAEGKAA